MGKYTSSDPAMRHARIVRTLSGLTASGLLIGSSVAVLRGQEVLEMQLLITMSGLLLGIVALLAHDRLLRLERRSQRHHIQHSPEVTDE